MIFMFLGGLTLGGATSEKQLACMKLGFRTVAKLEISWNVFVSTKLESTMPVHSLKEYSKNNLDAKEGQNCKSGTDL